MGASGEPPWERKGDNWKYICVKNVKADGERNTLHRQFRKDVADLGVTSGDDVVNMLCRREPRREHDSEVRAPIAVFQGTRVIIERDFWTVASVENKDFCFLYTDNSQYGGAAIYMKAIKLKLQVARV